ncbi:hypothetical protein CXF79_02800 [Colwellia sp. Bg11-28]|nr:MULTISPECIES: hypothetical protein [Colwellia]PKH89188.1 hypothetical protein CXF79_02800 [Colwellia sp. Bg11-28]
MCSLVILRKHYSTKNKTLLAEPFGQRLLVIFTALSSFYVDKLHYKDSALYKHQTKSCKSNLKRSAAPNAT